VLFHETGHFLLARLFGMKVEEFGIGIPPLAKILGKDRKGTTYTLNWLPIGGFVRIRGEDALAEDAARPGSFASKPYFARALVLLAGVTFNFLLAFFVFFGLFWHGVAPLAINTKFETRSDPLLVPSFEHAMRTGLIEASGAELSSATGSVAERAGIGKADTVIAADGKPVASPDQFIAAVKAASAAGKPLELDLSRSGATVHVSVIPENGRIGALVEYAEVTVHTDFRYRYGALDAARIAARETYDETVFTFELLGQIGRKLLFPVTEEERQEAAAGVGGPIAVGGLFVKLERAKVGLSVLFTVAALLSINLGAFNLLPLPALDGGRLFLMTIVEPFRKWGKISTVRRIESHIHTVGFAVFILLALVVAYYDIQKFF
jgi:regulator of sigma E protease